MTKKEQAEALKREEATAWSCFFMGLLAGAWIGWFLTMLYFSL